MEAESASLAAQMIKMGFTNVKVVDGGGAAMERYFEYYVIAPVPKIINPVTGKETVIEKK